MHEATSAILRLRIAINCTLVLGVGFVVTTPLNAQRVLQSASFTKPSSAEMRSVGSLVPVSAELQISRARLAASGLALGAAGAAMGLAAGYLLARTDEAMIIGAAVGESILLPYGIHRANERQGRLEASIVASSIVGGIGLAWVLSRYTDTAIVAAALVVPAVQLPLAIGIERASGR